MEDNVSDASKKMILSITIKDKAVLYAAYMPFLKYGGLFIPTKKKFNMGDKVSLLIALLDSPIKYNVNGCVAWITPADSQTTRAAGIGVQFMDEEESDVLRKRIEILLGQLLQSDDATHTM